MLNKKTKQREKRSEADGTFSFGRRPPNGFIRVLMTLMVLAVVGLSGFSPAFGASREQAQQSVFSRFYSTIAGIFGAAESSAELGSAATFVRFSSSVFTGLEGTSATVTVTREGDVLGASSVQFSTQNDTANGNAQCGGGVDYVFAFGTLNFAPGQTSASFNVQLCSDLVAEGEEQITLILSDPGDAMLGSPSTAVLSISDQPLAGTLALGSAAYSVAENAGSVSVTVTRSGGAGGAVTVAYTLSNGTATGGASCGAGVDFVNSGGLISFADGQTSQTFTVQICNESLFEGDETFNVTLSNATGGADIGSPSAAVITITNDDPMTVPGILQFSAPSYAIAESGGTATITVTRTGGSDGTVSVAYATAPGTAAGGADCGVGGIDYVSTSGVLTFAAGETSKQFTVQICDDSAQEGSETFNVTLSGATGGATVGAQGTAVVSITDNDPLPALSVSDFSQAEGNAGVTTFTFTVSLSAPSNVPVTVNYRTVDGTANAGTDYVAIANTLLTFNPGETSKQITISVVGDTAFEANETFFITLSSPANATIADGTGVAIILNDDESTGTLAISDARVTEGNDGTVTATFTVTLTGGVAATVQYVTVNGTALAGSDYAPGSGTLVFAAGETTKTIQVTVSGDALKEANETFFVILSESGGAPITDAIGAGIIVDDDRAYAADFDGDRRSDFSVYRPGDNVWYVFLSGSGQPLNRQFGFAADDRPVPGDYDGDGLTDRAIWRPSTGAWVIQRSSDSVVVVRQLGISTDKAVQGDYDGDGRTDIAVFRDGVWFVIQSSNGAGFEFNFGTAGDVPVQGDYDGDAKTDFAVYRQGFWHILRSSNGAYVVRNWGLPTDLPLVGDFDGDGRADLTVYRDGVWYVLSSLNATFNVVLFGLPTDIPVVADYDGDGSSDIAVFRPSSGTWLVLRSSDSAFIGAQWGQNLDIPIPSAYQSR